LPTVEKVMRENFARRGFKKARKNCAKESNIRVSGVCSRRESRKPSGGFEKDTSESFILKKTSHSCDGKRKGKKKDLTKRR